MRLQVRRAFLWLLYEMRYILKSIIKYTAGAGGRNDFWCFFFFFLRFYKSIYPMYFFFSFLAATVKCHIYIFIYFFFIIIIFIYIIFRVSIFFNRYFERSTHKLVFPLLFSLYIANYYWLTAAITYCLDMACSIFFFKSLFFFLYLFNVYIYIYMYLYNIPLL